MKRVYLSGPMSAFADSNFNYPAFRKAAAEWRAKGFEVEDPSSHFNGEQGHPKSQYMRSDIQAVLNTEAVIVLPGWENSEGACLEVAIAHALALPVFDATRPGEYVAVSGRPTFRVFSPEEAAKAITEGHKPVKPGDPGLYGLPTVDHPDPIAANPDYGDSFFAPPYRYVQPDATDRAFVASVLKEQSRGLHAALEDELQRELDHGVEYHADDPMNPRALVGTHRRQIEDPSPREFVNKVFREPVLTKEEGCGCYGTDGCPDAPCLVGAHRKQLENERKSEWITRKAVEDFSGLIDGGGYKASMDDQTKVLLDLIPPAFIHATGQVLTHGAHKYAPNNWMRGMSWSHVYGALLRHMLAWHEGEDIDPGSGLPHLAHAACNLAFLCHFALSGNDGYQQFDDRVFRHD